LHRVLDQTVATTHIDPPDLLGHANVRRHFAGDTKTNYPGGEAIFETIIRSLKKNENARGA